MRIHDLGNMPLLARIGVLEKWSSMSPTCTSCGMSGYGRLLSVVDVRDTLHFAQC